MFVGNVMKFGYGTLLIHYDRKLQHITIRHVDTPQPMGYFRERDEDEDCPNILREVVFPYNRDMEKLLETSNNITEDSPILEFRGYTLDFSNCHKNKKPIYMLRYVLTSIINSFYEMDT